MGHKIMLGLTSHPMKASGEQGLRSLPRGGALSPNFAALPALLKASPVSPSRALMETVLEVGREKHGMTGLFQPKVSSNKRRLEGL